MTSNSTNDQFSFWDMARAGIADLGRGPALARGVGMLAASRFLTHISIGRLVERHARRQPNRCALRFEQQSYSYAEFNAAANRYARVLQSAGVGSGDVVAMLLENRPETLLAVVATVKLGAVAAMCNTKQRGAVLAHSLSLVKPAAVLVGDELREAFGQVRADIGFAGGERVWRVPLASAVPDEKSGDRDLLAEAASQSTENLPETAMVEQSCPAFYIFTSGTTGMPKASMMSHTRWLRAGAGLGLAGMGLRGDDVFYCCLPLYHNNALTVS
ncbi:MAG: AMP-binding protein, partial [Salinisphaera sp.]|nr:AMP-binding protein [Salinisphaera sp.]